jgi:hypothetical protein
MRLNEIVCFVLIAFQKCGMLLPIITFLDIMVFNIIRYVSDDKSK